MMLPLSCLPGATGFISVAIITVGPSLSVPVTSWALTTETVNPTMTNVNRCRKLLIIDLTLHYDPWPHLRDRLKSDKIGFGPTFGTPCLVASCRTQFSSVRPLASDLCHLNT